MWWIYTFTFKLIRTTNVDQPWFKVELYCPLLLDFITTFKRVRKDFSVISVCSHPQSQRAQAPSLTGGHPRPTTVQHLTPQQLQWQKKPSGHRQACEVNALHVEVMSCLGGLILHQYCHGDNHQVMTSQLKSPRITNCRNLNFGSWQWRKSYQICVRLRELGILLGEQSQSECDVVHYDLWLSHTKSIHGTSDQRGKDFLGSVWLPGHSHNVCT